MPRTSPPAPADRSLLPALILPALILAPLLAPMARAEEPVQEEPVQEVVMEAIILRNARDEASAATNPTATSTTETGAQPRGLDSLLRDMAGVTTQGGSAAEAETAVNIRGLQDHGRVAVTLDGARQNFARAGHGANGSFALDPEMLRSATVTRGPGAATGAIAGAVALRSVSAEDLIPAGETQGGELRLRYGRLSKSPTLHAAWASQLGADADLTFAATRSETGDYRDGDGNLVPAGQRSQSGLLKFGWRPDADHSLTLSGSLLDRSYITGRQTSVPRDTDLRSGMLVLDHVYDPDSDLLALQTTLYRSGMELDQTSLDTSLTPTGDSRAYRTETTGLRVQNRALFDLGATAHELTLGLEAFEDKVTTRDSSQASLTPSGQRRVWGLSATDRIELGDSTLSFGLAAEGYSLRSAAGGNSGTSLSPRLALDQPLSDTLTLHLALAQGYRPPALSESLVDGSHPEPADFAVRPNPNLKGERATSAELGLSYSGDSLLAEGDQLTARATLFRNTVSDYIGMVWVGSVFTGYYQYQNINRVRIEGLELEADYERDGLFATVSAQHLRGIDLDTGAELSRVAPDRLVLTAGLRRGADDEIGARLTTVAAKTAGDLSAGSWTTLDLFLTRPLGDSALLALSVNNVLNDTYTPHLETQPAPGLNMQASLSIRF